MIPGVTFEEISNQIVDAYQQQQLETILRQRMNVRLDRVTQPAPFDYVVFQLVSWADREGRAVELVKVTAQAKPTHDGMQSIYKKYGMAIPIFVQAAGTPVPLAPDSAADSGLERIIRDELKFLEFGVWRERMTRVEAQVCRISLDGRAGDRIPGRPKRGPDEIPGRPKRGPDELPRAQAGHRQGGPAGEGELPVRLQGPR